MKQSDTFSKQHTPLIFTNLVFFTVLSTPQNKAILLHTQKLDINVQGTRCTANVNNKHQQ